LETNRTMSVFQIGKTYSSQRSVLNWMWCFTAVILATQKVEIWKIEVGGQPRQRFIKPHLNQWKCMVWCWCVCHPNYPFQKIPKAKRAGSVAQVAECLPGRDAQVPEFIPECYQKKSVSQNFYVRWLASHFLKSISCAAFQKDFA
jgi:hypothetical protein